MKKISISNKILGKLKLLVWPILFTLLYSPGIVYSSNQNQYFLHGLANANFGNLKNDWFVSTTDLKPAFSFLIELTHRIISSNLIYYVYYVIVLGIYFYSIIFIKEWEQLGHTIRI